MPVDEFDLGILAIRIDPEDPSVPWIPVCQVNRLGSFGQWWMATGSWVNFDPGCFGRRRFAHAGQYIFRDDQLAVLLDKLDLGGLAVGLDVEDAGLSWMLAWHIDTFVFARSAALASNIY